MVITTTQSDVIQKLLALAEGDRALVHAAIAAEADLRTGAADLAKVVKRLSSMRSARRKAA